MSDELFARIENVWHELHTQNRWRLQIHQIVAEVRARLTSPNPTVSQIQAVLTGIYCEYWYAAVCNHDSIAIEDLRYAVICLIQAKNYSREEAEEYVSEVILKILKRLDEVRFPIAFIKFISLQIRSILTDVHRKDKRDENITIKIERQAAAQPQHFPDPAALVTQSLVWNQLVDRMRTVLDSYQWAVITEIVLNSRGTEDVASDLGLEKAQIYRIRYNALAKLKNDTIVITLAHALRDEFGFGSTQGGNDEFHGS